jgi:hypothetical protein
MSVDLSPHQATLAEIKADLDPGLGYIILKRKKALAGDRPFAAIFDAVGRLSDKVLEQKIYEDPATGHFLLVLTVRPEDTDSILEEVFLASASKDFVYYMYGIPDSAERGP